MKRLAAIIVALALAAPAGAAELAPGRWQGVIDIPGMPIPVSVDLSREGDTWTGSVTMTGLGVKGAPLADIVGGRETATFRIEGALATTEPAGSATFRVRLVDGNEATLAGEFTQAGNRAPFTLRRTGDAQVDLPRRSTRITATLEGTWVGRYEMGGYPREVTLKLGNTAGVGTADVVIVGKRTTNLPISVVTESDRYLRIESAATGIHFEGRISADRREISGTFEQGPIESALVLRRPQ